MSPATALARFVDHVATHLAIPAWVWIAVPGPVFGSESAVVPRERRTAPLEESE